MPEETLNGQEIPTTSDVEGGSLPTTVEEIGRNWKVVLNNRCRGRANLGYITTKGGPEHAPTFTCEAQVNGTTWGTGTAMRKVDAELNAAKEAVDFGDANNRWNSL